MKTKRIAYYAPIIYANVVLELNGELQDKFVYLAVMALCQEGTLDPENIDKDVLFSEYASNHMSERRFNLAFRKMIEIGMIKKIQILRNGMKGKKFLYKANI